MRRGSVWTKTFLFFTLLTLISATAPAQKKPKEKEKAKEKAASLPALLWRDPGDAAQLDLIYGAGGKEHAPDPNATYTFLEEDMKGTSPKFDVKDNQGAHWKVKMGEEPQSETASTRLLYAAGYLVDEDYFLPAIKVSGLRKLKRGEQFISPDGTAHIVRLKRRDKEEKKIENWDWFDNPFLGTREFNGLRAMMALINNWDLTTENNKVYEMDGERHYVASDLGASFGNTGEVFTRSKSKVRGYEGSKFIHNETGDSVDFVMHSRPFFLDWFQHANYRMRTQIEQITKNIPRADAKWLGQMLSRLSDEQIRDCFRAAGYGSEEVEEYTNVVKKRIAELNGL